MPIFGKLKVDRPIVSNKACLKSHAGSVYRAIMALEHDDRQVANEKKWVEREWQIIYKGL